jgi:hypothetical protein
VKIDRALPVKMPGCCSLHVFFGGNQSCNVRRLRRRQMWWAAAAGSTAVLLPTKYTVRAKSQECDLCAQMFAPLGNVEAAALAAPNLLQHSFHYSGLITGV